ncbi:ATP-binding protein [Stenotrophomonas maltophilia]|uniref:ATP-binding protein n=1 Tax=Stenotrophomonas maltophilia TaxID=40324 RepID=UPI000D0D7EF8|nr:ATP-binding protein [Stenotrophomonas maltophilia]PSM15706.1 transcriptional regulator [Stenotrophomonas maltophilia]
MRGRLRTSTLLLLALILLPAASAEDASSLGWGPGREVRVATAPSLHPLPAALADGATLPSLAHGYANLVARRSQLQFQEHPHPSTGASVAAVCRREADLVLVIGTHLPAPCPGLVASRTFRGGKTMLAARSGERLPRDITELDHRVLAVVEGGPYAGWLAARHPHIRLLHLADRHATLAAVENGTADLAIGLETTLRPLIRRHFAGRLHLQSFDSDFSTDLRLLAHREDRQLLERIERALHDITLEEHASLLQLWAQQAAPASVEHALDWMRQLPPLWLPVLVAALAVIPFLWHAWHRRLRGEGRARARAIGMFSHEVRNSAQAVLASIDLLNQPSAPKGQREVLAAAHAAASSLRSLLNRSLEFSRLASGTFKPRARPCDIARLCRQSLDAIRPQARQRGLTLRFDCLPEPCPIVAIDPEGLRQIIDNLLGNALKFTDVGGIELRLQLTPGNCPRELMLDVIDSGIGITAEQLAVLFQPFQQGEDGRKRGGSGLGLMIAHELGRAMGGNLSVHSVPGRGSRFTLRLPVRAAKAEAVSAAADMGAPLDGIELLLVEDHALNRRVISEQLRRLGADVHAFGDAASALAEQAVRPRSVILLDIGLGDMDGYALALQLRRQARDPLRLIALSARRDRRHVARCRKAGFDATLTKPLQLESLLRTLQLPVTGQAITTGTAANYDPAYITDIGHELMRIEQAMDDASATDLCHHAHRLQGALQMYGAAAEADTAADLWALGRDATPDWADARRLLRVLQQWHGSRTAEAMPRA